MVTRILFDPRRDLTTGSTSSTPVTLEATPTGIREDGSVVVLPAKLSFTVNTAADVVQLAPPAASWAWRLVARQDGVVQQQRTVRFADVASVTWADLVDVDPATLGETAGHARQWDATFFQLTDLIQQVLSAVGGGGGGGGGFQSTQSTPASTWTIAHALGRRPGVELYTLAGERIFTDVSASTTQVVATFPSPQTGYAVLN